jgi:feruloyl esterase
MRITDIPNLNPAVASVARTAEGVAYVPAGAFGDGAPEYCMVTGTVITNPATGKSAHFGAALPAPANWRGRFLMQGCGGTCGDVFDNGPPDASIVRRGYAVWATDDGHVDSGYLASGVPVTVDSAWAVNEAGLPATDAITDYAHRAVHVVASSGKNLTRKLYGVSAIGHSYFIGCSDGGREAMQEAAVYPEDFDGLVAGAPLLDPGATVMAGVSSQIAQFRSPESVVPAAAFDFVSRAILAKCDATDGVSDGLVQNPAACDFEPIRDLPRCTETRAGEGCLSEAQIEVIDSLFSPTKTASGTLVSLGFSTVSTGIEGGGWGLAMWVAFPVQPVSRFGPYPFGASPAPGGAFWAWPLSDGMIRHLAYYDRHDFDSLTALGWRSTGSDGSGHQGTIGTFPDSVARRIGQSLQALSPSNPFQLAPFIAQGRKLLMWHGYADGLLDPYVTVRYYQQLADINGGYANLRRNVRLFMAPDVAHCGYGGAGPNAFQTLYHKTMGELPPPVIDPRHDLLSALEAWVEAGVAPDQIVASKYVDDDPSKPVVRSMPLCPFPAAARYDGKGDVNAADAWSCPAADERLLQMGPFGRHAGM